MKPTPTLLPLLITACLLSAPLFAETPEPLTPPPQDQGLPYTRSAREAGLSYLGGGFAVRPGSRYGLVDGARVRLSEKDVLRGEAFLKDGEVWVPSAFASLIVADKRTTPQVPRGLEAIADRWVFSVSDFGVRSAPLDGVKAVPVRGEVYHPLPEVAAKAGLKISSGPRGILVLSRDSRTYADPDSAGALSAVTLFDTPEKFADPDIATRHIPALTRQEDWRQHVKVTPEQAALLEGPETEWPTTPASEYRTEGIATDLFGSAVPEPGVYPRLLFSAEDLPGIAQRIRKSVAGRMSLIEMEVLLGRTWFDPSTSDGGVFAKLASGDLSGLKFQVPEGKSLFESAHVFEGQKPGIRSSHVAYVPECLTAIALYALITGDDERGRQAAAAVANYYRLREPLLDEWLKVSDSEFGSGLRQPDGTVIALNAMGATTHWRNLHGLVGHMNLGMALDFAGKWMSAEDRAFMQRFIAKATYGRRSYAQDAPVRFRDVNWMTWDLPHYIAVTAIEGLPGFDLEASASGRESVRAFCDWGIDPDGVVYESNGKTGGSMPFQLLSMVINARRGENLFAHPHWRNLLAAQVQMTSPTGRVTVNSGTQYAPHSRQPLSTPFLLALNGFYPDERFADYLLTARFGGAGTPGEDDSRMMPRSDLDEAAYRSEVLAMKGLRLPSISYPGQVRGLLYDGSIVPTQRADLDLPLVFDAPVHGVFSAFSDRSRDAVWINLMVRPNHYLGAGHHHADAGMFHFSALGVDWITESPHSQLYSGNAHNLVMVDGLSQADGFSGIVPNVINGYNAAATYLGAETSKVADSASADLTYAYSWRWLTQPPQVWPKDLVELGWEMDPGAAIAKIFAGTAHYKLRPWWPNSNYSNFIATSRAAFNPMQTVRRTVGLARGDHPFGYVLDRVKKDDQTRRYQWSAMLGGGVRQAVVDGIPTNAIVLGAGGNEADLLSAEMPEAVVPKAGDPLLMVVAVGEDGSGDAGLPLIEVRRDKGPLDRKGNQEFHTRIVVNRRGTEADFRILLIPLRAGEEVPSVSFDADNGQVSIRRESSLQRFAWSVNAEETPALRPVQP